MKFLRTPFLQNTSWWLLLQRSHKTDTTSYSKWTAAVIADIAIKDQVTDENDTLQVEKHLISSEHQIGGESEEFTRTNLLEFKVHWCRFENLPICSCLYKNNTLKISDS